MCYMEYSPALYVCMSAMGVGNCDSQWVAGDKAVGGRKEPPLRYDWGATNVPIGHEVKADLPGPLPQLGVLPSYDAVQLIGPGATTWHLTENIMREEACWMVSAKY